jgi:hypothetical protein
MKPAVGVSSTLGFKFETDALLVRMRMMGSLCNIMVALWKRFFLGKRECVLVYLYRA